MPNAGPAAPVLGAPSLQLQEESEDVTYWDMQYILQDTLDALQKLVPPARHEGQYLHPGPIHIRNAAELRDEKPAWGLNTDAHIIGSLLGRGQVVPVSDGALMLGEFGRLYQSGAVRREPSAAGTCVYRSRLQDQRRAR